MKKTAVLPGDYTPYAGWSGVQGYHPGLDDPTRLPLPYYKEPQRYDKPPEWVGKTTAGLIGGALLLGLLGKGMGWRASRQLARRTKDVAALEQRAHQAQRVINEAQGLKVGSMAPIIQKLASLARRTSD